MTTLKTSELTGAALGWAVATCEGVSFVWLETDFTPDGRTFQRGTAQKAGPHYSTDWAQGGPIMDREGIGAGVVNPSGDEMWLGANYKGRFVEYGPTCLIACMRCYVASKLGDDVDVPSELV